MSADGNNVDSKVEEVEKINLASGSKNSKETVQSETKENVQVKPEQDSNKDSQPDKISEMHEIKKLGKPMGGLPPINVNELTSILQDPAMPSHDLMKEIANEIKIRNGDIEKKTSDTKTHPLGMRTVFDTIMEVTLNHHDHSSDEEADEHEPLILRIPCDYCKKIFGSTMSLKTHILMTHSSDDPSVLNMKLRASIDDDKFIRQLSSDLDEKKAPKTENQDGGEAKGESPSSLGEISSSQSPTPAEGNFSDASAKMDPKSDSGSDKMPTATSATDLVSTSIDSPLNDLQSSLQNRNCSTDCKSQDTTQYKHDLKERTNEIAKSQLSSSSLPQSTSLPSTGGKRKLKDPSLSPIIKKSKQSSESKVGTDDSESEQESVCPESSSQEK